MYVSMQNICPEKNQINLMYCKDFKNWYFFMEGSDCLMDTYWWWCFFYCYYYWYFKVWSCWYFMICHFVILIPLHLWVFLTSLIILLNTSIKGLKKIRLKIHNSFVVFYIPWNQKQKNKSFAIKQLSDYFVRYR